MLHQLNATCLQNRNTTCTVAESCSLESHLRLPAARTCIKGQQPHWKLNNQMGLLKRAGPTESYL